MLTFLCLLTYVLGLALPSWPRAWGMKWHRARSWCRSVWCRRSAAYPFWPAQFGCSLPPSSSRTSSSFPLCRHKKSNKHAVRDKYSCWRDKSWLRGLEWNELTYPSFSICSIVSVLFCTVVSVSLSWMSTRFNYCYFASSVFCKVLTVFSASSWSC